MRAALPPFRLAEDERWPAVRDALVALAATRRRSLRLVDVACGGGELLLRAVRYARALGFTAIEARGIDRRRSAVARARRHAAAIADPAIGLDFTVGTPEPALVEETDFPADLILWRGTASDEPGLAGALRRAGNCVIAPEAPRRTGARAA